eukprot:CAMPEP_0182438656 /NCGR_PEP_ID=MMETSP1167-20130531/85925_1 /TAXON_ID=2988 /ORGANISM="Mallomonas Sp, Strain CCMP3275" /LENGTH=195 /DNA_ID=CAMNT_0024632115 /DNA_START=593 /DNA_END=1178 /DNA_ORIENTATION=+
MESISGYIELIYTNKEEIGEEIYGEETSVKRSRPLSTAFSDEYGGRSHSLSHSQSHSQSFTDDHPYRVAEDCERDAAFLRRPSLNKHEDTGMAVTGSAAAAAAAVSHEHFSQKMRRAQPRGPPRRTVSSITHSHSGGGGMASSPPSGSYMTSSTGMAGGSVKTGPVGYQGIRMRSEKTSRTASGGPAAMKGAGGA